MRRPESTLPDSQLILDRSDFTKVLNEALDVDPRTAAVITIDCHRGHLDPAIATMPVAEPIAQKVVAAYVHCEVPTLSRRLVLSTTSWSVRHRPSSCRNSAPSPALCPLIVLASSGVGFLPHAARTGLELELRGACNSK
jgi:hypothetical protein